MLMDDPYAGGTRCFGIKKNPKENPLLIRIRVIGHNERSGPNAASDPAEELAGGGTLVSVPCNSTLPLFQWRN